MLESESENWCSLSVTSAQGKRVFVVRTDFINREAERHVKITGFPQSLENEWVTKTSQHTHDPVLQISLFVGINESVLILHIILHNCVCAHFNSRKFALFRAVLVTRVFVLSLQMSPKYDICKYILSLSK